MKRILVALLLIAVAVSISGCGSSDILTDEGINRAELLLLHNKERSKRGIEQLDRDEDLERQAQNWAEWMAKRGSLRHSGLEGKAMAENIAMGQPNEEDVVSDWMGSSGHRANILNRRYRKAGFGYARRPNGAPYWCAQFGN